MQSCLYSEKNLNIKRCHTVFDILNNHKIVVLDMHVTALQFLLSLEATFADLGALFLTFKKIAILMVVKYFIALSYNNIYETKNSKQIIWWSIKKQASQLLPNAFPKYGLAHMKPLRKLMGLLAPIENINWFLIRKYVFIIIHSTVRHQLVSGTRPI